MEERTQITVMFSLVILLTIALFFSLWYAGKDRVNYCHDLGGQVVAANGGIRCVIVNDLSYCRLSNGNVATQTLPNSTLWSGKNG